MAWPNTGAISLSIATTTAVHTHACVPCSACLSRGLRPRRSAVAPQATDRLLVPGSTRSLRPAARAAWERSAEGALCFVLVYAACCEQGRHFGKRRNSNDEGYNGGGAHPSVCSLLGLSVSLPATTAFGSGCSHYVTACPLATRDASS